MQGASPQRSPASSSRPGFNKALAGLRAASDSPALGSYPLSRSSSLNRLSSNREPAFLQSASRSNHVSRDPSPGARVTSPAGPQTRPQGASYDIDHGVGRMNRAITDSPKGTTAAPQRTSGDSSLATSRTGLGPASHVDSRMSEADGEGQHSKVEQAQRNTPLSSPASGTSELANGASKKSTKLTTRQRLAKATKAGSRLLAASERRATPERRIGPNTSQASPPSKLGAVQLSNESRGSDPSVSTPGTFAAHRQSPSKMTSDAAAASTFSRRAEPDHQDSTPYAAASELSPELSHTSPSGKKKTKDDAATLPRSAETSESQRKGELKSQSNAVTSDSGGSAALAEKGRGISKPRKGTTTPDDVNHTKDSRTDTSRSTVTTSSRRKAAAPVQVVTMRKARPTAAADSAITKRQTAQASTSSKSSDGKESKFERPEQGETPTRHDGLVDGGVRTPSSLQTNAASAKKSSNDQADALPRKRRRTNDDMPSAYTAQSRERRSSSSSGQSTQRKDESFGRRREPSREETIGRIEVRSPQQAATRCGVPVSGSMPSLTSSVNRLPPVSETAGRDDKGPPAREYRDRRCDRSYDELYSGEDARQDRGESLYEESDTSQRGRRAARDAQGPPRSVSNSSVVAKPSSGSAERPIKGVGPGATHWSEPWLDVRSRADWHRLAQRFAKTQEEYLTTRKRLEAESEMLDRELELVSIEEQGVPAHPGGPSTSNVYGEVPAEQNLLSSQHKTSASDDELQVGGSSQEGAMRDLEVATAINTSINSQTRTSTRAEQAEDVDDSPEEGEMRSSDDEGGQADTDDARRSIGRRSPGTASSDDPQLPASSRRSESPDNIAWRSTSGPVLAEVAKRATSGAGRNERNAVNTRQNGADRPLSYTDLANRVQQLAELHGSLSRMHRVLVDFKAKSLATPIK